jgi:integrase
VSLREARHKQDELAAMVFSGESPARQKQLEKFALANSTSVQEFAERYFTEVIQKHRKNPIQLRRYLQNEIYPAFGGMPLREVTAQEVQRLVFRKRDNGFGAAAAELRNLIKRIFDYAIVYGLVTANPGHATPMRFITRQRSRTRSLSPDEITCYLGVLYRSNIRRQFKLALHIILLTLVRKSELLHARWENVNFERAEWLIPEGNSKTGKLHTVSMPAQVTIHSLAAPMERSRIPAGRSCHEFCISE